MYMKDSAEAHSLVIAFFQAHNNQEEALQKTKQAIASGLSVNCIARVENMAYYLKEAPILYHAIYNNLDKVVEYLLSLNGINIRALSVYRDISHYIYDLGVIGVWSKRSDLNPLANGFRIISLLLKHGVYVPDKYYNKLECYPENAEGSVRQGMEINFKNTAKIMFEKYKLLSTLSIHDNRDVFYHIMDYGVKLKKRFLIIKAARYNFTVSMTSAINTGCLLTIRKSCYRYLASAYNCAPPDREEIFQYAVRTGNKEIIENIIRWFHPKIGNEQAIDLIIQYNFDESIVKIISDEPRKMLAAVNEKREIQQGIR